MTAIKIIQLSYIKEKVCMLIVFVCVCLADVLCSLPGSQQYLAADTLFGQAEWLTGVCLCLCVCVVFLCGNRRELALPPANQCPLEGLWIQRQRVREAEGERKTEREKEQALGEHFLLSFTSQSPLILPQT